MQKNEALVNEGTFESQIAKLRNEIYLASADPSQSLSVQMDSIANLPKDLRSEILNILNINHNPLSAKQASEKLKNLDAVNQEISHKLNAVSQKIENGIKSDPKYNEGIKIIEDHIQSLKNVASETKNKNLRDTQINAIKKLITLQFSSMADFQGLDAALNFLNFNFKSQQQYEQELKARTSQILSQPMRDENGNLVSSYTPHNVIADDITEINRVSIPQQQSEKKPTLDDAVTFLKEKTQNGDYIITNKELNIPAQVTRKSIDKMDNNYHKSKDSNVPADAHATAMMNLNMFEDATHAYSYDDYKKNSDIVQMHVFFSVMNYDGKDYGIKFTVKEFVSQGNRLYAIETQNVEVQELKSPENTEVSPEQDLHAIPNGPDVLKYSMKNLKSAFSFENLLNNLSANNITLNPKNVNQNPQNSLNFSQNTINQQSQFSQNQLIAIDEFNQIQNETSINLFPSNN